MLCPIQGSLADLSRMTLRQSGVVNPSKSRAVVPFQANLAASDERHRRFSSLSADTPILLVLDVSPPSSRHHRAGSSRWLPFYAASSLACRTTCPLRSNHNSSSRWSNRDLASIHRSGTELIPSRHVALWDTRATQHDTDIPFCFVTAVSHTTQSSPSSRSVPTSPSSARVKSTSSDKAESRNSSCRPGRRRFETSNSAPTDSSV